ncbi:MAG: acyltransferase [Rhodobacteraceae bacterium]|nr:acyltransferase [Paracoccaceae bacterium]
MISRARLRDAALYRLARLLRPYLARTPLIWGDADRLTLGKEVHLVDAVVNLRSGRVTIGDHSFLGHGVMLLTGRHDYRATGPGRQAVVDETGNDIIIGKGVWIASGAIVIGPCSIGDNAVIGAGCVVSGTIPADTITTGSRPRATTPLPSGQP